NLLSAPPEHIAAFRREPEHPFRRNRIVISGAELVANVLDAKASPGEIIADRGVVAARRFLPVVAPAIEQDLTDRRGQMRSRLQLDKQRGVALDVGDVVRTAGILPGLAQVLGQLIAGTEGAAIGELLVDR